MPEKVLRRKNMASKHVPHRFVKDQDSKGQEIADYMSSPIISVNVTSTIKDTAQLLSEKNIGSLLVEENDAYIGIVTETDLTRKVLGKGLNPDTTKVSEIMVQPIISLDCHLPITKANSFMAEKKIRHLAITDNNKIVGMISVKDLVAFFANPRLR
jgi:signal-transduction protein with cAMP-binding, CBS, and nucleotidyltransferase domain